MCKGLRHFGNAGRPSALVHPISCSTARQGSPQLWLSSVDPAAEAPSQDQYGTHPCCQQVHRQGCQPADLHTTCPERTTEKSHTQGYKFSSRPLAS